MLENLNAVTHDFHQFFVVTIGANHAAGHTASDRKLCCRHTHAAKASSGSTLPAVETEDGLQVIAVEDTHQCGDDTLRPDGGETRGQHDDATGRLQVEVQLGGVELTDVFSNVDTCKADIGKTGRGLPEGSIKAAEFASSPVYWKNTASLSLTRPTPIIMSTLDCCPPANSSMSWAAETLVIAVVVICCI